MKHQIIILLITLFLSTIVIGVDADMVISVEYFYFPPCPCEFGHMHEMTEVDRARALVLKIENEYRDRVRIEWIDVTTTEGSNLLKQYNITETPTIVINHEHRISGKEITWDKLKLVIDGYLTGSHLPLENKKTLSITAPLIIVSGLVDGVNPCAFALLIFFLSFLYSVHKTRGDIFKIGGIYVLSLFATYFAGGLGLLRTVTFFGVEHTFSQIGVILIILLGMINVKDSLKPGGFSFKFPERAFPGVRRLAEMATIPAAFVLGGLVGLCAFPCSGGIYIGILALLATQSTYLEGLVYLVLYNIMFILPLVFMLLFASNRRTLAKMNRWNIEKRGKVKLISGVFMIILGLLTWYWITM